MKDFCEKGLTYRLSMCYDEGTKGETPTKGGYHMGSEAERQDARKAMAFDLCNLIDENAKAGKTFTPEEVKTLIKAYVITASQK